MTNGLTTAQRAEIIAWAQRTRCITEVRLFGSRVKNTHRPDSDIDIAVTMISDGTGPPLAIYLGDCDEWEAELTALLGIPADVERYDPVECPNVFAFCAVASELIWIRP